MNSRAIAGLVGAAVAGIVGYVFLKRFLDREMPEVAQFPDNEPVVHQIDETLTLGGWTRRERPQRHEEPQEHSSEAEIRG